MRNNISQGQFSAMFNDLNMGGNEGGFTVEPTTGKKVTTGIMVAPADQEKQVPASSMSPDAIRDYHTHTQAQAKGAYADPRTKLGGWNPGSGKDVSLDTPMRLPERSAMADADGQPEAVSRADAMTSALDMGIRHQQDAVFRLSDFKEVGTGFDADKYRRAAD